MICTCGHEMSRHGAEAGGCIECRCTSVVIDPANWTPEQARATQAELDELERIDPDVAAAAASYDRMVERMTGRQLQHRNHVHAPPLTTTQPTDEQQVEDFLSHVDGMNDDDIRAFIAQALADQAAAIHARYALIADGFVEDNPRRQWIADAIKVLGRGPA